MFDDQRKTPRFAWAKALNAAGGVRIGSGDEAEALAKAEERKRQDRDMIAVIMAAMTKTPRPK